MNDADPAIAALPSCDLVMKGGITSGVVYPKLIAHLAGKYRFQCVGGTSAGAIAAAGCVAAEYGRQRGGNPTSFEQLAALPGQLGATTGSPEASMLFHLFRPAPALRHHFAVLLNALNRPDKFAAVAGALRALLIRFWPLALLSLVAAALVGVPIVRSVLAVGPAAALLWMLAVIAVWAAWLGIVYMLYGQGLKRLGPLRCALLWVLASVVTTAIVLQAAGAATGWPLAGVVAALAVALVLCLALALVLAALRFGVTLLAGLHRNRWGLCSGHEAADGKEAPGAPPALTDWLTGYFNGLAGMEPLGRPLTFGDLWGEPPGPIVANPRDTPPRERQLDLQVMTTAVSQRMCYAIPFRGNADTFFYDPAEWAELFPPAVMQWLDAVSAVEDAGQKRVTFGAGGPVLRRLPSGRYLPVVVAVRMSLSFPVLLSAMPLYAIDYSMAEQGQPPPPATRVWFSDGGIASNMPLHFFDAPLPGRPTFAINLKAEHPKFPIDREKKACDQEGRVYLADNNNAGRAQHWAPPADDKPAGIIDFLAGIVDTMQSWRDEIQFPYPGYRDRIVQISQLADEGGLNLNMPRPNIDALSDAGECAAERIVQRFHPASTAKGSGGWENHEEIRLRTFLGLVEELATHPRVQDMHWDAVAADAQARGHYDAAQQALARAMLGQLRVLGATIGASGVSLLPPPAAPRPRPQMRIAPRI